MSWMEKLTGVALPEELASNTIVFNDEQGRELVFEFLDLVRWRGQNYAILVPEEETDDSGEVVILREEKADGDREVYSSETDEEILLRVYERFRARSRAMFGDRYCFSVPRDAGLRGDKPLSVFFGQATDPDPLDPDAFLDSFGTPLLMLINGDGEQVAFDYLDLIEYEGREYVVLLPAEDDEDSEVVILRVSGEAGEEVYCQLQDEQTLLAVYTIFKNRFKDTFHFS